MSAKRGSRSERPPKLTRRIERLERRIRIVARKERRQMRQLDRIKAQRATLNGRLAALRATPVPGTGDGSASEALER